MPHLLHLGSSARRSSFSRALSARYAAGWAGTRTCRDLAADPVPVIGEAWTEICDALLTKGITDPAHYADVVLIGVPMYNFSIPAALKAGTPRAPFDHHERYLRDFIAGHYDVDDVRFALAAL